MGRPAKIKVLVADDDGQFSRRLSDYLCDHGFDSRYVANGLEAKILIAEWKPKFILADLMLPECNALEILDFIRSEHRLRHQFSHVIVMSGHNNPFNVKTAFSRGAKDYLVKPSRPEDVLKRLVFHCRSYRGANDLNQTDLTKIDEASLMLHLTDLVLRQAISGQSIPETLFNLTRMVSMKVDGVRCSVIHVLDQRTGIVVTSNDNRNATGIMLDLNKYPEVQNVMNNGILMAVENLENSPELKPIKKLLKDIMFNSMIICPVSRRQKPFGVLSLRMPPEKVTISDNEIRFVEIVSHTISLVLNSENFSEIGEFWKDEGSPTPLPFPSRNQKK